MTVYHAAYTLQGSFAPVRTIASTDVQEVYERIWNAQASGDWAAVFDYDEDNKGHQTIEQALEEGDYETAVKALDAVDPDMFHFDYKATEFNPDNEDELIISEDLKHFSEDDLSNYEKLIAEAYRRMDEEGVHPDDATWNVVMNATALHDGALMVLYDQASEEAEEAAHWDYDASPAAQMQAIILAELRLRAERYDLR